MADAIVVGAGIFGSTVARALREAGRDVLLVDRCEKLRGSQASGNLMKPGWFAGLGAAVYEPSLELLERLYGVQDLAFRAGKGKLRREVRVHWVPTFQVLAESKHVANVTAVDPGRVTIDDGEVRVEEAPLIVVCAGYWTRELLADVGKLVVGKQGISFRWLNATCENLITPWAPYKQVVQFTEINADGGRPGIWAGDGTAILADNWTTAREDQSRKRVLAHVGKPEGSAPLGIRGIRPFVKGAKPCLLEEVAPGLWCATGGAKNGMVAAGWVAHTILERTS